MINTRSKTPNNENNENKPVVLRPKLIKHPELWSLDWRF